MQVTQKKHSRQTGMRKALTLQLEHVTLRFPTGGPKERDGVEHMDCNGRGAGLAAGS